MTGEAEAGSGSSYESAISASVFTEHNLNTFNRCKLSQVASRFPA